MGSTLRVGIIDDGINEKLYKIGSLDCNVEITKELKVYPRVGYDPFLPSHGTTCAAIINKYAPDAVLSSIKILNDDCIGARAQLVKALEWCADNGIKLVNLSLGTIDFRDFKDIRHIVDYAVEKGLILVAACINRDIITYPASLPDVIGVKCDKFDLLKEGEYEFNYYAPDGIEITACGKHFITNYNKELKEVYPSNSFATPLITAYTCNIMAQNPGITFEGIKEQLRLNTSREGDKARIYPGNLNLAEKELTVPLIALLNLTGNKALCLAKMLSDFFRKDGYNSVAVTDAHEERNDCNIVFLRNFCMPGKENIIEGIKTVTAVYDPDILILETISREIVDELDNSIEVDIKVFITDKDNSKLEKLIKAEEKSNFIFLGTDFESSERVKPKFVKYSRENTITELYKYIINLFEKD